MSNPYKPVGQCTWWCAEIAPWCTRYGLLGNALDWAANWRAHGGFVQMTPAVGTIACFQPGSNQADAVFGHVAVVVSVKGPEFVVSEENGPLGPGRQDDRTCLDNAGVSFLVEFAPTPPEDNDLTAQEHAWLEYIFQSLSASAPDQGVAPWNNIEIIRRQNVQLGADYQLHPGPVPPPKAGTP